MEQHEDSLVVDASTFKVTIIHQMKYYIEIRYKTSIWDNVKHWNVFEDDQQLRIFLEVIDEFSSTHIYIYIYIEEYIKHGEEVDDIVQDDTCFNNHIESRKVLQLKNDFIPKYLIPLEKLYDQNYMPTNPAIEFSHFNNENLWETWAISPYN